MSPQRTPKTEAPSIYKATAGGFGPDQFVIIETADSTAAYEAARSHRAAHPTAMVWLARYDTDIHTGDSFRLTLKF